MGRKRALLNHHQNHTTMNTIPMSTKYPELEQWRIDSAVSSAKAARRFIRRVRRIKKWVAAKPPKGEHCPHWMAARPPQSAFPSKNAKHKAYGDAGHCCRLIPALKDHPLQTIEDMEAVVAYVESL
jgi:hypothetical protein